MITAEKSVEQLASLVHEIEALAEHARLHGPAPDCAARVEEIIGRHKGRIEAAKRVELETSHEPGDAG